MYANHVLTRRRCAILLASGDGVALDGFIGPSHVSTVIGSDAYADIAVVRAPVVITGFEPLDVLIGVHADRADQPGRAEVENQFIRAVTATGNRKEARQVVDEVFACARRLTGAGWARWPPARWPSARNGRHGTPR